MRLLHVELLTIIVHHRQRRRPERAKAIVNRLEAEGWVNVGGGKHDKFERADRDETVIVPRHKEQSPGQRTSVPRLSRRKISRFDRIASFVMSYRSKEYRVSLLPNILDDIDRTNYESDKAYETVFDAHLNRILLAAASAIEAGRSSPEGALTLEWADFSP